MYFPGLPVCLCVYFTAYYDSLKVDQTLEVKRSLQQSKYLIFFL